MARRDLIWAGHGELGFAAFYNRFGGKSQIGELWGTIGTTSWFTGHMITWRNMLRLQFIGYLSGGDQFGRAALAVGGEKQLGVWNRWLSPWQSLR
jgi:hypothetical protein